MLICGFFKFFFVFIDLEKNSGKRIYFMQIYSLSYELWIKIIFFLDSLQLDKCIDKEWNL